MLYMIINDEEVRLLFYAVAFLLLTLFAEKYIERKYNPFNEEGKEK